MIECSTQCKCGLCYHNRSKSASIRFVAHLSTWLKFPSSTKETLVPDALELLKIRRSVKPREMSGPGPTASELDTILTIGARVPDHGKLTPWRFIVFEGDARARAGDVIARVFAKKKPGCPTADVEIEKRGLMDAPLVIAASLVGPRPGIALEHDEAPRRQLAVIGHPRANGQDGARVRSRWGRARSSREA